MTGKSGRWRFNLLISKLFFFSFLRLYIYICIISYNIYLLFVSKAQKDEHQPSAPRRPENVGAGPQYAAGPSIHFSKIANLHAIFIILNRYFFPEAFYSLEYFHVLSQCFFRAVQALSCSFKSYQYCQYLHFLKQPCQERAMDDVLQKPCFSRQNCLKLPRSFPCKACITVGRADSTKYQHLDKVVTR